MLLWLLLLLSIVYLYRICAIWNYRLLLLLLLLLLTTHELSPYGVGLDPDPCPPEGVALIIHVPVILRGTGGATTKLLDGLVDRHVIGQHLFPDHKLEFVFDVGVRARKGSGLHRNIIYISTDVDNHKIL